MYIVFNKSGNQESLIESLLKGADPKSIKCIDGKPDMKIINDFNGTRTIKITPVLKRAGRNIADQVGRIGARALNF